jgi:thiamine-phosphate pyrophosphorylase
MNPALHGLYVITDPQLIPADQLVKTVALAIAGGARIIQYRNKHADPRECMQELIRLRELCHHHDAILLINDDVQLAKLTGADGVHLGQDDISLQQARAILGDNAIIGITCHGSLELAHQAVSGGADYIAFGRFFPSHSKPEAPPADIHILEQAKQELNIPIVAIGGITPENAAILLRHGADMLAVIHGVFAEHDIEMAARRYTRMFAKESSTNEVN